MFKHIAGSIALAASLIGGGVHYHATHSTMSRIPTAHIRTTSIKMPRIKSIKIPKIH